MRTPRSPISCRRGVLLVLAASPILAAVAGPGDEPPVQPPVQPPAVQTPAGQPPAAQAPAVQPPAVQPPTVQAPPGSDPPATAPAEKKPKKRVIVHPDRHSAVRGYLEFEDDTVLFVRTLDGKLTRFHKDKIRAVVRLVRPTPDQKGVLYLRDGSTRRGIIIEDSFEHVIIELEGVRARHRRNSVDHVELEPTFDEMYAGFRESLKPEMPYRHLALCRWLADEDRFELAERELVALLEMHSIPEARELLRVVRAQRALEAPRENDRPPRRRSRRPRVAPPTDDQLLSEADVNLIRVYEIDFSNPPKVAVPPDAITRLRETYASSRLLPETAEERLSLHQAPALDIVRLMFALKARELYPQIDVLNEPHALNLFRQRVHDAWLMNSCATSACHGGPRSGRLRLFRTSYKDARVRYTNLLTLERFEGDPEWPLVNYEEPLASLIIQYGLPRNVARQPHPPAPGWKPVLRRTNDRMVRNTVEWIQSMMLPRVDYPVDLGTETPGGENPPGKTSRKSR